MHFSTKIKNFLQSCLDLHDFINTNICTYRHTNIHAHTHAHTHTLTYTHTCTAYTHTNIHTHIHAQHIHTQTYTHTYMHIHTQGRVFYRLYIGTGKIYVKVSNE